MRRKQLQLLCLTLLVEHFDGLEPSGLGRTVQLTQITQRLLPRSVGGPHRFHQRPIHMILSVFLPLMGAHEHLAPIMPLPRSSDKTLGLHYIGFFTRSIANTRLARLSNRKKTAFHLFVTNLG